MATDLTRFDFHALRFITSDTVEVMTAEEIGQYILLLCRSWLSGKECSLPNDLKFLARIARADAISERVLEKFPIVTTIWGERRRNGVLYGEWTKAIHRSEIASEKGQKGNEARYGSRSSDGYSETTTIAQVSPQIRHSNRTAVAQAKPNQANPVQSESNQSNFRNIAIKYRAAMGKSHSKSAEFRDQYSQFCAKYGEDVILKDFEDWVVANEWRSDKLGNRGLYWYFKDLPDRIEELNAVEALKPKETTINESEVERINHEENEKAMQQSEERLKKIREDEAAAEELKAHPFEC